MAHFVDDADNRGCQLLRAIRALYGHGDVGFHAAHLFKKVDVEIGATELAVGDRLQAHILLEFHNFCDGLVFHQAQLLGRDLAFGLLLAGFQQVSGAQKTAHMVITGGDVGNGHSAGLQGEGMFRYTKITIQTI